MGNILNKLEVNDFKSSDYERNEIPPKKMRDNNNFKHEIQILLCGTGDSVHFIC